MATRSRIGIELKNGSVLSVYHHYDGYPDWLGRRLVEHYNSRELASQLIDGGDMTSCWTDERWDDSADGSYGPQYYSQRGENVPPRHDKNLDEYLKDGEEYAYLMDRNGNWKAFKINYKGPIEKVEIPNYVTA